MRAFRIKVTVQKAVWQNVVANNEDEAIKKAIAVTEGQVQACEENAWPEFQAQTIIELDDTGLN